MPVHYKQNYHGTLYVHRPLTIAELIIYGMYPLRTWTRIGPRKASAVRITIN